MGVETELEQAVCVLEAAARFAFAELAVNKIVWERWDAELLHVDGPLVKGFPERSFEPSGQT